MKSFWLLAFLVVGALARPQARGGHHSPRRGYHHDDHEDRHDNSYYYQHDGDDDHHDDHDDHHYERYDDHRDRHDDRHDRHDDRRHYDDRHHDDRHHDDHDYERHDPHDDDNHEDNHFVKVHSGQRRRHGNQYDGQGYHNSEGHFIKVYHSDDDDHHDDHRSHDDHHHDDHRSHDDHHDDHKPQRDDHHDDQESCQHDDNYGGWGEWEDWGEEDDSDSDCDCGDECHCEECGCNIHSDQSEQVDALVHQLNTVKDLLDESINLEQVGEDIEDMDYAVDDLEGHGCEHFHEFQCGGEHPHCVSNLMMCDGHDDCESKMDEDDYHCHVLAEAGSKWNGTLVYDHCTQHKPKSIEIDIQSVTTISWFSARPQIKAHILMELHGHGTNQWLNFHLDGYWSPADRSFVINPPETDGLAMTCTFHGHDHTTCEGHIVRINSFEPCAEFTFHRM